VEVGRVFADSVEIKGGVSEGDKIVTEGAFVCKSDVLREKMGAGCAD
jgi:cobalt-zinc-cadmium efflux system membrane fusion protein